MVSTVLLYLLINPFSILKLLYFIIVPNRSINLSAPSSHRLSCLDLIYARITLWVRGATHLVEVNRIGRQQVHLVLACLAEV